MGTDYDPSAQPTELSSASPHGGKFVTSRLGGGVLTGYKTKAWPGTRSLNIKNIFHRCKIITGAYFF